MSIRDAEQPPMRTALSSLLQKGSKTYDLIAAAPLIVWYCLSAAGLLRLLHAKIALLLVQPSWVLALTVLSKVAILFLALAIIAFLFTRRPPTGSARGWAPRIAALLGTYLSVGIVLLPPREIGPWWLIMSYLRIVGGMAFASYAIAFLGRSFSLMAEARQLVTGGPYSRVRHPLYVGEELAVFGAVIQYISPLALVLLALQICCQFYRMRCEEAVLDETFPAYGAYRAATARLIPGIY